MTRKQLVNKINKAICDKAHGLFSDSGWAGQRIIEDIISNFPGINIKEQNSHYLQDHNGNPVGKMWNYVVTDGLSLVYVFIHAAGAGSVKNPLSKYDITSYAS
jgi:hypothetical protein